jgi:hypothetical protein
LPPLRKLEEVVRLTLGEEVEVLVRPKPPLRTVLEGLRAWKLFWEEVGLLSGALMLSAVLPALGEVAVELTVEVLDELQVELLVTLRVRWR